MSRPGPIASRVGIGLFVVATISLLGFAVLSAYAPDLRSETSGRSNALSNSAIGFAGIRFLAQASGIPTEFGRTRPQLDHFGLVVLTPEIFPDATKLKALSGPGPRLIILPKWATLPDQDRPGWVMKVGAFHPFLVASAIAPLLRSVQVHRRKHRESVRFHAAFPAFDAAVPDQAVAVDSLQTISGPALVPLILDDRGKAVVANLRSSQVYVAADPDLFNNFGLRNYATARAAVVLLDRLRTDDRPISFDLTLHGFGLSPDLLRAVFSPPILGATLCVLLAGALMAAHAMNRFGSPRETDRVYAFGKRALADNTAAVIHLMQREPAMAPRYADAMLRLVTAQLGATLSEDERWIASLERRAPVPYSFAALRVEAAGVTDVARLLRVATKLHQWSWGLLHERR